ncbi:MAG: serine hydrolase domain-containing protein [Thermomicrobiales bacterium]
MGPIREHAAGAGCRIPGAEFRYSGAHYSVIEMLMQDVTGEAFPDLMRWLIFFDPLEMTDSSYDQAFPESRPGGVAIGHDLAGEPLTGGWHLQPEYAGAGLWTTPADLCRLRRSSEGPAGDSPAFSQDMAIELEPRPGPARTRVADAVRRREAWFRAWRLQCRLQVPPHRRYEPGHSIAVMTNGDAGPPSTP